LGILGFREEFPSKSLSRYWTGSSTAEEILFAMLDQAINPGENSKARNAMGDAVSAMNNQYQLIRNGDETEELYDYRSDPEQTQNLILVPEVANELEALRLSIRSISQTN
jgi:hypothetical protein